MVSYALSTALNHCITLFLPQRGKNSQLGLFHHLLHPRIIVASDSTMIRGGNGAEITPCSSHDLHARFSPLLTLFVHWNIGMTGTFA
jgi:hypothetical protein